MTAACNEVGDGFGLREVDFVVEVGAAGVFTGFGEARTGIQHGGKYRLGDGDAAVSLDFEGVFAGVGVRRGIVEE